MAAEGGRVPVSESVRRGPLRLLPGFLFDTAQSKAAYVAKAWLLSFIPSMVLAGLVAMSVENPPAPEFGGTGIVIYLMAVIFAPVTETLLMVPPVLLLNRFFGPAVAAIGSAALWGTLHSLATPLWGLIIWWPFLLFSTILLAWRRKSLATGMVLVMTIHAMQNGVAGLSLLFG